MHDLRRDTPEKFLDALTELGAAEQDGPASRAQLLDCPFVDFPLRLKVCLIDDRHEWNGAQRSSGGLLQRECRVQRASSGAVHHHNVRG